jgi:hypothetical protein
LDYTPIRNNYLNLITERFPGLAFLELSPFDKMQFLIGDVSFSLDTNIGLFFDKIGKAIKICFNEASLKFPFQHMA